ncbi:MAG: hypothetical protein P8J19_02560 [Acidimicrobiales bacterium]|nr:hypothetical protein [Acidimicrobiales bacterium]
MIAEADMVVEILNRREFSSLPDQSPTVARKVLADAFKHLHEVANGPVA